jgi:hypothetical protein
MTQALTAQGLLIEAPVELSPELEHLIPTDPIEARVHMRKRANVKALLDNLPQAAPTSIPTVEPAAEEMNLQDVFASIDKDKEKNSARRNLLVALCDTAEKLMDQLTDSGKTLGVSELRHPPLVISESGQLGVLVQSFTVVRQGTTYKGDFKVNGHPVTVHNQDMTLQRNGEKLIRSNREDKQNYQKGRHELYVKGMNYQEGAVYLSYVMVDGEEDSELTNYYQLQGGQAVKVDARRYRKVETLLASGRDPALSISDPS